MLLRLCQLSQAYDGWFEFGGPLVGFVDELCVHEGACGEIHVFESLEQLGARNFGAVYDQAAFLWILLLLLGCEGEQGVEGSLARQLQLEYRQTVLLKLFL